MKFIVESPELLESLEEKKAAPKQGNGNKFNFHNHHSKGMQNKENQQIIFK